MKHILFFLIAAIAFLCSCSNDIEYASFNDANRCSERHHRDYNSALAIAKKAVFGTDFSTRSIECGVKNHYLYSPETCTRSVADNAVSFYVINFENDKGFAVISEDDRATPVYAYSNSGNLDLNNVTEESGWSDFMDAAYEYYNVQLKDTNKLDLIDKNPYGDVAFVITEEINGVLCKVTKSGPDTLYANAFLSTEWDQCLPYNYYCPVVKGSTVSFGNKAAAGCVPVALGQIMAYNRYPEKYKNNTYNWSSILSKSKYLIGEYTTASLNTAQLLHDIGVAGDAQFGTLTSMSKKGAEKALSAFGYTYSSSSFSSNEVWRSLENNRPVFIAGSKNGTNTKGHAWVIDGGKAIEYVTNYHYPTAPFEIFKREVSRTMYFHCNWGEGGYGQSSAYCLNVFEAPNKATYDVNPIIIYNIHHK